VTPARRQELRALDCYELSGGDVGALLGELLDALDEAERRSEQWAAGSVQHQRHRDAWRAYAYGKRERPGDYVGEEPGAEPTEIERLTAERDGALQLHAESKQNLCEEVRRTEKAEAEAGRLREALRAALPHIGRPTHTLLAIEGRSIGECHHACRGCTAVATARAALGE